MRYLVFGALLLCGACASQVMEGYVGKSIQEPMLDYGPPTSTLDLGGGRRAFQWRIDSTGVVPMTSTSSFDVHGSDGHTSAHGTTTSYVPYSKQCLYTLTAVERGKDYIVDGFRKPSFECE
ncbi:hypothetical protein PVT71_10825 [Salipiger sp. H15]|uniref:Lipoprotein n=1 Tax=Alloyangia sp. H15 TaxID=3029062 RepID=A0AAU8AEK7_9RHOB